MPLFQGLVQRHGRPIDAVTVLSIYVVVLMAVPSLARFPPAGSIGAPATLLGILIFCWWLWEQAHRSGPSAPESQWVRRAAVALLVTMLAVYGVASLRPLPGDEVTPAASGVLQFVSLIGLTLAAAEGVLDKPRLHTLLSRITIGGICLGCLALIQFFTGQLWIDKLVPPFLSMDLDLVGLGARGGFSRPSATATHPLEFGTVVAMILPLAIVRARVATDQRFRHWFGVGLLLLSAMVTLSRSAMIGTVLALVVLAWPWSWRDKVRAAALALLALAGVVVAIPGLVGTLRGLFVGSDDDPSVRSRAAAYPYVFELITRFPIFGKGYGTFLPKYWILDNGFLNLLVSAGALGVGAFLALLGAALYSAGRAARYSRERTEREVSQALLAGSVAGASSVAFFDIFAFPQAAGLLFLFFGLCGAVFNIRSCGRTDDSSRVLSPDRHHAAMPLSVGEVRIPPPNKVGAEE